MGGQVALGRRFDTFIDKLGIDRIDLFKVDPPDPLDSP
jgi:hypothetical protein